MGRLPSPAGFFLPTSLRLHVPLQHSYPRWNWQGHLGNAHHWHLVANSPTSHHCPPNSVPPLGPQPGRRPNRLSAGCDVGCLWGARHGLSVPPLLKLVRPTGTR